MTPEEYVKAIKRIEALMELEIDPEPNSAVGLELIKLVTKVEKYESRIYPMARVLPDMLTV